MCQTEDGYDVPRPIYIPNKRRRKPENPLNGSVSVIY
jgi:hypothetical protein